MKNQPHKAVLLLTGLLIACGASEAPPSGAAAQESSTTAAPPNVESAAGVLGTIEATVDGSSMTWYIVSGESGGQPYSTGLWYEPDDQSTWGVIGGFETPDPPVETFQVGPGGMPESYGDYRGSLFTLQLAPPGTPSPFRVDFPSFENSSSLIYVHEATLEDVDQMFSLESGSLNVTRLAISDGRLHAEGTFSGVFESFEGATLDVTDGRFSVEGAPHMDALTRR